MTIVVTGGAGFIGSHLCERLLDAGNSVICIDNVLTGSAQNIEHLLKNPKFLFVEHDIIEPFFLDDEHVDHVYNLACPASPVQYQKNPVRTIKTNTIGMINVLGFARHHGARVLQASTSEVYGDPEVHPQTEDYRGNVHTVGPRACYDEGKRCAESLCMDYHRMHGMEIKIARIFNTYGPRMAFDDGRVVSNFLLQAIKGDNVTIYGNGTQTRSFCYVDDLVEGLIRLMHTPKDVVMPVNLGNPEEYTMQELAEMILELTQSTSRVVYAPLPEDDPKKRRPDISRAKELLDWEPTISLRDGLVNTLANFRSRL